MKKKSKKSFIESVSPHLPAKDVVKMAKVEGIRLTPNHVYTVRSDARKKKGVVRQGGKVVGHVVSSGRKASQTERRRKAQPVQPVQPDEDWEADTAIRRAIITFGLERARRVMREVEEELAR